MKFDDFVVVIVSYFSYGWTRQCLESLWKYFPECRVLAVDNNPSKNDSIERKESFENLQSHWPYKRNKTFKLSWKDHCELETQWLNSQQQIETIQTPIRLDHGQCLNLVFQHCFKNKIKKVVLIEPDCKILGKSWMRNLLNSLDEGYWMSSGQKTKNNMLHPCPSAWIVEHAIKLNFQAEHLTESVFDEKFFQAYFKNEFKRDRHIFLNHCLVDNGWYWDTGMKAWYELAKIGRAKYVSNHGFHHYWGKSARADFRIMFI